MSCRRGYRLIAVLLFGGATGCSADEPVAPAQEAVGSPWFVEEAAARGLSFKHESGASGAFLFPEVMGGGAALFDMDRDGDLDVYLVQSGVLDASDPALGKNQLFENDGTGNFTDVSAGSGADDAGYGMGVAVGDYDGDGDADLYVTNVGRDTLLRNDGGRHFVDVTVEAGLAHDSWGTSAAFLDYDKDGDLDLFVCDYVAWTLAGNVECSGLRGQPDYCSPNSLNAPLPDRLYRNEGHGRFTETSAQAGMRSAFGNGLGVVAGDFDGDSWVDIFVANDQMPNQLWRNQRDGTFVDVAMAVGCAVDSNGKAKAGMGTHAADADDDGDLDLFVVNLHAQSDSLYRNEGDWFRDDTARSGLGVASRAYTRFGTGFVDFDNDGWLDIYQANGRVTRPGSTPDPGDPMAEPNLVLRGLPKGRYEPLSPPSGTSGEFLGTSRAAAFGDLDGDGGVDVIVVNRDREVHLFRNAVAQRGNWIRLKVLDGAGRTAIGASAYIELEGRTLRRDVMAAYSYCSSSDPTIHAGVGAATSVTVEVQWPDGTRRTETLAVGEEHTLRP